MKITVSDISCKYLPVLANFYKMNQKKVWKYNTNMNSTYMHCL